MSYEPYICALDPDTETTLKVYLFKNVRNVEAIRSMVLGGSWGAAAVSARLVVHPRQLAAAANRAALAARAGAMITRSVYAELLYNLSLSKNISQSLAKFGVGAGRELLVCFLETDVNINISKVLSQIEGDMCPMEELPSLVDVEEVQSVYKLNKIEKGSEDLLDIIISRMVTKQIASH